jgi:hypothetical protein
MNLPKFLKDVLTGKDGETHDVARHSWLWTTLAIIAGGIWNAVHAGAINVAELAQAFAVNVGAHGAAIWAKRGAEPEPPEADK